MQTTLYGVDGGWLYQPSHFHSYEQTQIDPLPQGVNDYTLYVTGLPPGKVVEGERVRIEQDDTVTSGVVFETAEYDEGEQIVTVLSTEPLPKVQSL